jgi:hypothetical protein
MHRNETERPLGGGGAGYGEVATYVDMVDILNLAAVAIIAKVRTSQEQERKAKTNTSGCVGGSWV